MKKITKQILFIVFIVFGLSGMTAQTLWWSGQGADNNWTNANNWSTTDPTISITASLSPPSAANDVIFNAGSFPNAQAYTITLNSAVQARSFLFNDKGNATSVLINGNGGLSLFGGISLISVADGLNYNHTGGITFKATTTGNSLDFSDQLIPSNIIFDGNGGGWIFNSDLRIIGAKNLGVQRGSVNFNDKHFDLNWNFVATSTNTDRSLLFGNSTFNIRERFWNIQGDFAELSGTPSVNMNRAIGTIFRHNLPATSIHNFNYAQVTAPNMPALTFNISGDVKVNALTLKGVNLEGGPVKRMKVGTLNVEYGFASNFGRNHLQVDQLAITGNTCELHKFSGGSPTGKLNFTTAPTIPFERLWLRGMEAQINGVTASPAIIVNNGRDDGNNHNWVININPVNRDLFWIGNSGEWFDESNWSLTSGGTPLVSGVDCGPTIHDNVFFDANSFNADGQAMNISGVKMASCNNMTWDGLDQIDIDWTGTQHIILGGDLTLDKNMRSIISYNRNINLEDQVEGRIDFKNGSENRTMPNTNFIFSVGATINQISDKVYVRQFNMGRDNGRSYNIGGNNNELRLGTGGFQFSGTINMEDATIVNEASGLAVYYDINLIYNSSSLWRAEGGGTFQHRFTNSFFPRFIQTDPNATMVTNGHFNVDGDATINGTLTANGHTNITNTFILSDKTHTFRGGFDVVVGALDAAGAGCGAAPTLKSSDGTQFDLNTPNNTTDTQLNFATISDVNYIGDTNPLDLSVQNVIDGGNNTNVTIGAATAKTFYWRPNPDDNSYTGNWTNPKYWAINKTDDFGQAVAGGCIPTAIDSVVFDDKSSNGSPMTVIIDSNQSIKAMEWVETGTDAIPANMTLRLFTGATQLNISSKIKLASQMNTNFHGGSQLNFSSTDSIHVNLRGKTIHGRINFNDGIAKLEDGFVGNADIRINDGEFHAIGHTIEANNFFVMGTSSKKIDISDSDITLKFAQFTGSSNQPRSSWRVQDGTNVDFTSIGSTINVRANFGGNGSGGNYFYGGGLTYNDVLLSTGDSSQDDVYELDGNNTITGRLTVEGVLRTRNSFSVNFLNLKTDRNHRFKAGEITTILPDGNLEKNGDLNAFLNMQSDTNGTLHNFVKASGGNIFICNINVLDIQATGVPFKTNNVSTYNGLAGASAAPPAGTSWDFTAASTPAQITMTDAVDLHHNVGDEVSTGYQITLNNTGPYQIEFTTPTGPVTQDDLSDGDTTNGVFIFTATETTDVEITNFRYFDCPGGYNDGTVLDDVTPIKVPSLLGKNLAVNGDTETYTFNNIQGHVYVMNGGDRSNQAAFESRLPQVAIQDGLSDTDTEILEDVTVSTIIDPTHITINPFAFLTRRWNITNTGANGKARIKLFLSQAELQSLKITANKTGNTDEEFLGSLSLYRYDAGVTPAAGLNFEQQSRINSGIATEISNTTYYYEAEVSAIVGSYALGTSIAPGGVASSIKLWIKADKDVTTSGSEVSLWKDQSGSGVDFENTGLATGINGGPMLNTNSDALLSYQPVISFDGTQGLFESDRNILFPNNLLTIWMIVKGTSGGTVLAHEADLTLPEEGINPEFTIDGAVAQRTIAGATETLSGGLDITQPSLIVAKRADTGSFNWELTNFKNGSAINTTTFTGELEAVLDQMSLGYRHQQNGTASNALVGDVAEVVLYGVVLNTQDDLKVASYLAGKYGITLNHNYVSSDDNVIFDIDGSFASYANDIILIGRDDQSDLEKRQAKSVNTGAIVRMGLGNIEATNAANTNTFTSDFQFLVIGNDGANTNTIAYTTGGNQQRLERIWRTSENGAGGDIGAVVLEFDLNSTTIIGRDVSDFSLIIKNADADFSSGVTTIAPDSFTNGILRFNAVDLSHGDHFTIASSALAPGTIANNLQLWLKADTGVTLSGSEVTQWDNVSNPGSVIAMDLSGTEEVTVASETLNFNDELTFPGGAYFETSEQFIGNDNAYTKFVVYRRTSSTSPNALVASAGADNTQSIHGFYYQPDLGQPNANDLRGFHGSNDGNIGGDYIASTNAADLNTYYIAALRYGAGGTESNMLRINAEASPVTNTTVQGFNDLGTQIGADQGGGAFNNTLNGNIAEVIVYDRALPNDELQRIESYLAIKYGITLENNYVSATATTIFDTSNGFANDVAGIGREDNQGLSQIKSKSLHTDAIVTIGHSDISVPTALANDASFFIWGNNNGTATWTVTSAPSDYRILTRQWRIQETGTVGAVKIQFDVEDAEFDVPILLGGNVYHLIYDSDGDQDLSDETPISLTNVSGDIWETTTALDISNNRIFTLATAFEDTDGDTVANSLDIDDDNDGILDTVESGGNDPLTDADGDNVPLYLDDDDSLDTIGDANTVIEAGFDIDGDGVPNHLDLDADNDGIPDNVEAQATGTYSIPVTTTEAQYVTNNGVNNAYLTTNAGGPGLAPVDTDGNVGENAPDYLDTDADDDTILDIQENGDTDNSITTFADVDGDGIDDLFDTIDNTTIWDVNDAVTTGTIADLQGIYDDLDNDAAPTPVALDSDLSFRDNCQIVAGAIAGDQIICPDTSPATFTQSTAASSDGVLSYQWQLSTTSTSAGFSDISGATSETYSHGNLSQTTYFKRVDKNTLNGVECTEDTNVITVTVEDTVDPTASNPANVTVECSADVPAVDISVVTDEADNCSAAANITVAHVSDVSDGNSNPEVITRTYSVTDEAGNSINVTQTITVNDTINPTASNPANVTVECSSDVPAVDISVVTNEADNCSAAANITVAHVSDVSDGNSNPEVITRTYSVTDEAGNSINVTQTITVNDTINPTTSNPANVTVECSADVPAVDISVVTDEADNCSTGANITVAHVSDVSDGNSNPEVITRTYSVIDEAGNSINVTQTITVNDTINPTASNPANVTVECSADVPAVDISVVTDEADNCSAAANITVAHVSDVSDGNSNPEVITRTYSVTDEAGNSINVTQTITVNDTINPTASNPANVTVECSSDVPAVDISVVTDEADNCSTGANITVAHVSDVSDGNSNPEVITRTYSVIDEVGNSINVTQTITVNDTINPTASNPANVTVECSSDVPAVDISVVTDEADNCSTGANITVAHVSDVSDGNSNPEVITRTYSVTDEAGNSINVTQTITVNDTINPTASNPANVTVECSSDVPAVDITVVTDEADNCSTAGNITIAHVSDVSDGNSNPEVITRTYSVTDEAGNSINVTQTITVNDIINPTASNPAAVNVQCSADVLPVDITVVTDEADNCSASANITVAHVSDVSDGNSNPEVITRTYSVTDEAGNSINVTQTITINDTTNPTASNPTNVTVECSSDVPVVDISVVTDEADNCSTGANIVVAHVSDVSDGNSNPEVITRTYSVTDEAGNSINVTQTITVNDTTDPTASNPTNVTVECSSDVPAVDITVVTDEADNCSTGANITVAHVSDVSDGNSNPEVITRTYSVTDEAGNSINVTQTITVHDTTNPTASNPAAVNVQCSADVPAVDNTVVTDEADNCSAAANITVAHVSDVSDGNSNPEVITRTYSVTDEAGNSINVTQTITVHDTTNPTASNPAAVNVQCSADVPAVDISVVTDEADNCSTAANITVAHVSDVSDGNSNPEVITRTYSVTDEAGNSINVTQTITVNDITNPIASNPAAVNVQCSADVPAVDISVVTDEADNCSTAANITVAHVSDVSDGNSNPEVITRTYSVTDEAGNSINVTQTITVNDTTDPTASNPANVTVECSSDVPAVDISVITDEADNCSTAANITVAHVSDVSDGNSNPEIITRTYSVTDEAGNSINVTQTITVNDTTDPTASNPANVTVECSADVPAVDITVVTDEADNCSAAANITVAHVSDVSDGNSNPEVITRTYSVTDEAGNSINVTQTITINDTTNPTASNPANVTVECSADVPAVDISVVTDEADNCSTAANITVAHVSDVSDGNSNPEVITRTYSVTDEAGNNINVTQTITVNDTTNPTASNPADITIACGANIPNPDTSLITNISDNCSTVANIVVAHINDISNGNSNPEIITRTYSVTDEAGNSIMVSHDIVINELQAGIIAGDQTVLIVDDPAAFTEITPTIAGGTINYQWQISTTSATIGFSDIAGATSVTYDSGIVTQDTWFRRIDTSTLNGTVCSAFTNVVMITIDMSLDSDSDGIPDVVDLDDDNDGITDEEEENGDVDLDTDGDGIIDRLDLDADGDGIYDVYESGANVVMMTISSNGVIQGAVGNDGIPNAVQNVGNYDNGILNYIVIDTDGDAVHDFQDVDDDGDGLLTVDENPDENQDGNPEDAFDTDGDGIADYLEPNNGNPEAEDDIEVFSGISPNGDGINDRLMIRGIENLENTIEIFNRWGAKVYETSNYGRNGNYFEGISEGNATIRGSKKLPTGTYFYILRYALNSGEHKSRVGYLYIN